MTWAPRQPVHPWRARTRGAAAMAGLWLAAMFWGAGPVAATPPDIIVGAQYEEPTTRYAHGVLGDEIEWGALRLTVDKCLDCPRRQVVEVVIRLPENRVFEDIAPRIWAIDADDPPKVVVVESDIALGARLAVYDETGLVGATPFIGRANRWLAPVGIADFDGDGWIEVAYVDRPHLARTLRLWRYQDGALTEIAALQGVTNHRIGQDFISGGVRDCGAGPEIIVADGGWTEVLAVRFEDGRLKPRSLGPFEGPQSLASALACGN